jgi:hypothetical protein
MFASKARLLGLALGLVMLLAGGALGLWAASARPLAAGAKDSKLKVLLKERFATLQEVAAQTTKAYHGGQGSLAQVLEANLALRKAELDLCDTDKERVAVLGKMLAGAKDDEKRAAEQVKSGVAPPRIALKAKVSRLEVEIALERLRGR